MAATVFIWIQTPGGRHFHSGDTDTDVVRLYAGSGHDTAYDFNGEDDYIYVGSIPESDIIFTQTGPRMDINPVGWQSK